MNDEQTDIAPTGEDNIEDIEIEEIEKASAGALKKVKEKLKKCEQEKLEHLENLQRAKAEFLNAKKRLEEQKITDVERLTSIHVEKLLPLCDSFQMAMQNQEVWQSVDQNWRSGIESIYTQLQSILTAYEVKTINPAGEKFNPVMHEAMTTVDATEGVEADTVMQVLQLGYERKGELIRPAKVILSK